jgi:hypothetical protein
MNDLDLTDILGTDSNLIGDQNLLSEEPLMATRLEVENANRILQESLQKEMQPLPHAQYKKFDPLGQASHFDSPGFNNPQELVDRIDEFFRAVETLDNLNETQKAPKPTLSALAMHLNISRKKLIQLEEKPVYGPIISAAKTRIEAYLEEMLLDGRRTNTGGVSLVLKNGFDWKEKQEVSGELTFSVTRQMFTDPNSLEVAPTLAGETENA